MDGTIVIQKIIKINFFAQFNFIKKKFYFKTDHFTRYLNQSKLCSQKHRHFFSLSKNSKQKIEIKKSKVEEQ
ncbi:hypothetical protein BpHYR1_022587 [Brachionus plicatilis]|uniref:Uncharacterized protein n=1 Tax=Brachionus plicatilis TaxID=10195 RepID=A0A3M7T7N8_BRAPC|nr:hypothetical protein BpHYR1_022587 [Brachionus plicatilis]